MQQATKAPYVVAAITAGNLRRLAAVANDLPDDAEVPLLLQTGGSPYLAATPNPEGEFEEGEEVPLLRAEVDLNR